MSVMNVSTTQRQCPRCRRLQPAHIVTCGGCGRRFQVPPPEPPLSPASGVYAGVSTASREETSGGSGPGVSAWWGPAFAALFVTPLGWALLPLALALCVITAALSLTVLPTLLAVIAAVRLRASRLPFWQKGLAATLTLGTGLGLNALLWHVFHQIAFTLSPPP